MVYDRKEHLKQLHINKREKTFHKVDAAINRLIRGKDAINFNNVSKEAGVSKATLYNNLQIRERIESLRQQQANVPTPKQVKRAMNDNNKDAMIASLKRRIAKLEQENKELKTKLNINYAEIYNQV
jgi:hypothetical protein